MADGVRYVRGKDGLLAARDRKYSLHEVRRWRAIEHEAGSKMIRLSTLAVQGAAFVAAWGIWKPSAQVLLPLALVYVLATWIVAGGITLGTYLAVSLAPLSDLLAASWEDSAVAMWLVPGALLVASRSQLGAAAGLALVVNSTRLLASSRAPKGESIPARRRAGLKSGPLLFRYQQQPEYFSRAVIITMLGALVLQVGIYALAGEYPLLAAISFAAVTAIWIAMAVARGATAARSRARARYSVPSTVLTILLTITVTAALIHKEIVQEFPRAKDGTTEPGKMIAITRRVLQRLAHVPPAPSKVETAASQPLVTEVVGQAGVPGMVLRPRPKRSLGPRLVLPGSRFRFTSEQPLAMPFTGEYQLFPSSSVRLPRDAIVETGTPMENLFATISGGPMETVAVQTFDPPIDLTNCGKVLVSLTSAEDILLMASIQLEVEGGVEDGETVLMGMKRQETLSFQMPAMAKPLLVHAIRILFLRPVDRYKNSQVSVEGFTLVPRGR